MVFNQLPNIHSFSFTFYYFYFTFLLIFYFANETNQLKIKQQVIQYYIKQDVFQGDNINRLQGYQGLAWVSNFINFKNLQGVEQDIIKEAQVIITFINQGIISLGDIISQVGIVNQDIINYILVNPIVKEGNYNQVNVEEVMNLHLVIKQEVIFPFF